MLFLSSSENEIYMGMGNDLQNIHCGGKQVQEEKKSASGLLLHCFAQMFVQIQKCKH